MGVCPPPPTNDVHLIILLSCMPSDSVKKRASTLITHKHSRSHSVLLKKNATKIRETDAQSLTPFSTYVWRELHLLLRFLSLFLPAHHILTTGQFLDTPIPGYDFSRDDVAGREDASSQQGWRTNRPAAGGGTDAGSVGRRSTSKPAKKRVRGRVRVSGD